MTLLVLGLLGSLVLPQLLIPDEKHNADMVLMAQQGEWLKKGWPGLDERSIDPSIIEASLSLGPRERALRENRAGQHPPFFFLTSAATSSVALFAMEDPDLSFRLWTYRLVSVIASALLPITYYLIASELTESRWVRLATAILPLFIPGITLRDAAMVNTDALLLLLTSTSVLMGIRVAKGDLSLGTAVALGVSTGLSALTKGHALLLVPVLIGAYLLAARRDKVTRHWWKSIALSGGIALVVGGWWWIRNLLLYGMIQPVRASVETGGVSEGHMIDWFTEAVQRLVGNFWGGGFALRGPSYRPLFWILTGLFIAACVAGWLRSSDRGVASVSASYAVLLILSILVSSAYFSAERGRVVSAHGRYFYPGLAGLAPLVALGAATSLRRLMPWLPAIVVLGSLAMNLTAIEFMLGQYWGPAGSGLAGQWAAVRDEVPITETMSTVILLLTVVSFLALLVSAIIIGLRSQSAVSEGSGLRRLNAERVSRKKLL